MATIDEISEAFYHYSFKRYEEELKNSDEPSEKSFPDKSTFQEDFQTNISAIYHDLSRTYPPEQANYIYRTLLLNLDKQLQNPGQSKIVDASKGTINVQNLQGYSKKVQETLKSRHPEKFEIKDASLENKTLANNSEKVVDFNNPQEKKMYFENLFEEYSNLKTFEEKQQYFSKNFYDISNLSEEEQKQELNAYEIGNENKQLYDRLQEDNSGISDEEDLVKLYDEALEKKSEETGYSFDYLKKCDEFTLNLEKWKSLTDGPEKVTFFEEKITPLRETLSISREQQENIINSIKVENEKVEDDFSLPNIEESETTSVLPELEEKESEIDSVLPGLNDDELEIESVLPGLEEKESEIDSVLPELENEELVEENSSNISISSLQPDDIPIPENKEFNSFGLDKEDLVEQSDNMTGKELAVIPQKNRVSEFFSSIIDKIKNSKLFNNLFNRQTDKSQNEINLEPESYENARITNNSLDYLRENAPSYEEQHSTAKMWKEEEKKKNSEQKSSSAIEANTDDSLTI